MRNAQQGFCRIHYYCLSGFFSRPSSSAASRLPPSSAPRKPSGFPITGSRNNPPWGAGQPQPRKMAKKPASALPAIQEGPTRSGSRRAKGRAPLRHEGKSHDRSLGHAAALRGGESCREQHTGQRQPQRRDHAARHDGSHKIILQIDQCQCAADIGGFIDRSAVVGGHHAAHKRAQQQAAAALHLGQAERHPPVEAAQRRIDDHKHQPADE